MKSYTLRPDIFTLNVNFTLSADGFPQRPVDHNVEITEAWMIAVSQVPKLDDSCDSILLMKEFPATVVYVLPAPSFKEPFIE